MASKRRAANCESLRVLVVKNFCGPPPLTLMKTVCCAIDETRSALRFVFGVKARIDCRFWIKDRCRGFKTRCDLAEADFISRGNVFNNGDNSMPQQRLRHRRRQPCGSGRWFYARSASRTRPALGPPRVIGQWVFLCHSAHQSIGKCEQGVFAINTMRCDM